MKQWARWCSAKLKKAAAALQGLAAPVLKSVAQPAVRVVEASARRALRRLEAMQADQMKALEGHAEVLMDKLHRTVSGQVAFTTGHAHLLGELQRAKAQKDSRLLPNLDLSERVRSIVRKHAGLPPVVTGDEGKNDLTTELRFLWDNSALVRQMLELCAGRRVLYSGQCYYNHWYLSRELRKLGWRADVLNWDPNPASQIYYHGEDFRYVGVPEEDLQMLRFFVQALYGYDVFHFSNAHGISFGSALASIVTPLFGERGEIYLLKELGKKVAYTNNGCLDGVSQTAFSRWGPDSVCAICRWRNEPAVCSDELNLRWGRFRNSVSDYQCLLGGNRVDFNDDPRVHESPWVYCLDPDMWKPGLDIPEPFRIERRSEKTLLLYHAIGNKQDRTTDEGVNIKSSHVYLPLLQKLRDEGWDLELLEPTGVPNKDVRFIQAQADIFLEMLTFGWFGANAREAMMLGKPVVCFIRPEWLDSLREELPDYADELPIVSATPETVESVLVDLMGDEGKRREIGRRSREFMLRWHSAPVAAAKFEEIYGRLIAGEPLLRKTAHGAGRTARLGD
ncbi:glycosyltransferase [Ramlibacter tataouinensis]|uniref:glycosyltransferase n=1 Tax=Ramlibacter tataouinensis TaxID=94132 RepID=UPI0022F3A50D|nr:glycosyltransferase [Ramlibacter tataouinensis]WBY00713.1 glycosyltransferase [Ramlibacter tataouinensis]